jgi:tRNA threonylcarbamoyladenosine biosynthesis protein TsaB
VRLLALDTSTDVMAVALADGDVRVGVDAEGGAQASDRILPTALALLAQRGLGPSALDAVAFGQGPGAFTGLRTAVSVAQGLAFGICCPVLPIDSLLIVAEDARAQALGVDGAEPFELWVAMDARMDEVYAAAYRHDGHAWQVRHAPALYDLTALAARWQSEGGPRQVAGSAIEAFADRLPWADARRWPRSADRAAALLRLACTAWLSGRGVEASAARPVYLRDKVALTTAEREAARAGAATP